MELTCRVGAAASVCGQLFDTFGYLEYLNCKRIKAAEVTNYSLKKSIAEISDAPAKWILPFGLRTTSDSVESVRKEGLVQLRPNPLCENDDPRNDITFANRLAQYRTGAAGRRPFLICLSRGEAAARAVCPSKFSLLLPQMAPAVSCQG